MQILDLCRTNVRLSLAFSNLLIFLHQFIPFDCHLHIFILLYNYFTFDQADKMNAYTT